MRADWIRSCQANLDDNAIDGGISARTFIYLLNELVHVEGEQRHVP